MLNIHMTTLEMSLIFLLLFIVLITSDNSSNLNYLNVHTNKTHAIADLLSFALLTTRFSSSSSSLSIIVRLQ